MNAAHRQLHEDWRKQRASLVEARLQVIQGTFPLLEDEEPEEVISRLERIIEQADAGLRALTGQGEVQLFLTPAIAEDTVH